MLGGMADPRRDIGSLGERIAAAHLAAAGYSIVARNFRTREGELDLVAVDRGCLVFCEVKTRVALRPGGATAALDGVHPAKRRRLRRLARAWLASEAAKLPPGRRPDVRFDAIGVALSPRGELLALEHVEAAF
jgi:putative endonuclease